MTLIDLQQSDTSTSLCATNAYCSVGTQGTNRTVRRAQQGDTAGVTGVAVTVDNADTAKNIWWHCVIPAGASWDAGNWTVRLNVTGAAMNTTWEGTYICRLNSACANQASIGSLTGQSIDVGTTGVKTFPAISGAAQTPSAGDLVMVICRFTETSGHGNNTITYLPDQLINTPFDDGVTGTAAGYQQYYRGLVTSGAF